MVGSMLLLEYGARSRMCSGLQMVVGLPVSIIFKGGGDFPPLRSSLFLSLWVPYWSVFQDCKVVSTYILWAGAPPIYSCILSISLCVGTLLAVSASWLPSSVHPYRTLPSSARPSSLSPYLFALSQL